MSAFNTDDCVDNRLPLWSVIYKLVIDSIKENRAYLTTDLLKAFHAEIISSR